MKPLYTLLFCVLAVGPNAFAQVQKPSPYVRYPKPVSNMARIHPFHPTYEVHPAAKAAPTATATVLKPAVTPKKSSSMISTVESIPSVQPSLMELLSKPIVVKPNVAFDEINEAAVMNVHLRPLYTTVIRVPYSVSLVAVGAPTLFEAEHKASEPDLVFVKPSTFQPAQSNLLIALKNGEVISVRLISPGAQKSKTPVDFVVDYKPERSLFGATDPGTGVGQSLLSGGNSTANLGGNVLPESIKGRVHGDVVGGSNVPVPPSYAANVATPVPPLDAAGALAQQERVAAPVWLTASQLRKMVKADAKSPNNIAVAIGDIRQKGDSMTIAFSVMNISDHWITLMPPQVDLANPLASKRDKKKNGTFAEPVKVENYYLANPKLSPGSRADISVTIDKPESKYAKESLLLHIATSAAIDKPVYFPLPFVAPSSAEALSKEENANGTR